MQAWSSATQELASFLSTPGALRVPEQQQASILRTLGRLLAAMITASRSWRWSLEWRGEDIEEWRCRPWTSSPLELLSMLMEEREACRLWELWLEEWDLHVESDSSPQSAEEENEVETTQIMQCSPSGYRPAALTPLGNRARSSPYPAVAEAAGQGQSVIGSLRRFPDLPPP